jgi:F-type H+-transporting ATPase subunit delta
MQHGPGVPAKSKISWGGRRWRVATGSAKRYARAAFELATDEGRVEEWGRQLAALRDIVSDPKVASILRNPTISPERRMELLPPPPVLEREAINLARLLIESRRTDQVGTIADEFERLADEAAGRVRATVTTAVELSPEARDRVAHELAGRLHEEVRIHAVVDPRILGGLKLQYGDHVIDASVATRLDQLRRLLAGAS